MGQNEREAFETFFESIELSFAEASCDAVWRACAFGSGRLFRNLIGLFIAFTIMLIKAVVA